MALYQFYSDLVSGVAGKIEKFSGLVYGVKSVENLMIIIGKNLNFVYFCTSKDKRMGEFELGDI